MQLIGLQYDIAWEDRHANFAKVRQLLGRAELTPGALVVLPEMFATGFTMNTEWAEVYGGETERFLSDLASEYNVGLVAGVALRGADGKLRNKALVFSATGALISFYAKMRPFTPGGESAAYTAGQHVTAFPWGEWKVSPFICYDLRFPELFREAATKHRPELFVVIANFPAKRAEHWRLLLQARAVENQAYVIGVNRVGRDPLALYSGHSLIVSPAGQIIAEAKEDEEIVSAELGLESLRDYRRKLPFLDDLKL
jgi:predicted amidohydrolase